ncbi:hypothetical protein [Tahibacter caeni]|uniref:hypothetical protein n=1 Tax=Tahibacter caeni TaxID=1453545 RepID=UPI0021474278|nr:hypothetical protein [Tahibacter caeni]
MRSSGTLRYSPELRPGSHRRRDGGSTRWWLILDGDPELGRYLRHLHWIAQRRLRSLQAPLWGTHVSVIRGELPPHPGHWGDGEGERVDFTFDPLGRETNGYVWFPVRCAAVLDLRERLGLPREPQPPLHLTVGNR